MIVLTNNNEPLTQSDGKVYSDILNGENDFYYHRYKDDGFNKLYLSSKYLKDAVISGANEIEKIFISSNGVDNNGVPHSCYFYQSTIANSPEWTKYGMRFVRANNDLFRTTNDSTIGIPSGNYWWTYSTLQPTWYFGMWHKPTSIDGSQWFGGFGGNSVNAMRMIWNNSSSEGYTFFNGSNILNSSKFEVNNYNYIASIGFNGLIYCFINGVLLGTITDNINLVNSYIGVRLGNESSADNASDCFLDDILFDIENAIIDPTGFVIGDKVFEPPMRGGFDSIIKQY